MTALIIGIGSDIARNISQRLIADGWQVFGTTRSVCDLSSNESIDKAMALIAMPWDLLVVAAGSLGPIGKFSSIHPDEWAQSARINALGPLRVFHHLIPHRKPDSCAVFFSGTNPLKVNPGYSAYSASKAMLVRAVQEIDAELDTKCFTIAPGFVRTKIHSIHSVEDRGDGTDHEDIYHCLQYLMQRPKSEVGGRVFHVPTWKKVMVEMS